MSPTKEELVERLTQWFAHFCTRAADKSASARLTMRLDDGTVAPVVWTAMATAQRAEGRLTHLDFGLSVTVVPDFEFPFDAERLAQVERLASEVTGAAILHARTNGFDATKIELAS